MVPVPPSPELRRRWDGDHGQDDERQRTAVVDCSPATLLVTRAGVRDSTTRPFLLHLQANGIEEVIEVRQHHEPQTVPGARKSSCLRDRYLHSFVQSVMFNSPGTTAASRGVGGADGHGSAGEQPQPRPRDFVYRCVDWWGSEDVEEVVNRIHQRGGSEHSPPPTTTKRHRGVLSSSEEENVAIGADQQHDVDGGVGRQLRGSSVDEDDEQQSQRTPSSSISVGAGGPRPDPKRRPLDIRAAIPLNGETLVPAADELACVLQLPFRNDSATSQYRVQKDLMQERLNELLEEQGSQVRRFFYRVCLCSF